jgi:hypothetical protein
MGLMLSWSGGLRELIEQRYCDIDVLAVTEESWGSIIVLRDLSVGPCAMARAQPPHAWVAWAIDRALCALSWDRIELHECGPSGHMTIRAMDG